MQEVIKYETCSKYVCKNCSSLTTLNWYFLNNDHCDSILECSICLHAWKVKGSEMMLENFKVKDNK